MVTQTKEALPKKERYRIISTFEERGRREQNFSFRDYLGNKCLTHAHTFSLQNKKERTGHEKGFTQSTSHNIPGRVPSHLNCPSEDRSLCGSWAGRPKPSPQTALNSEPCQRHKHFISFVSFHSLLLYQRLRLFQIPKLLWFCFIRCECWITR